MVSINEDLTSSQIACLSDRCSANRTTWQWECVSCLL